MKQCLICYEPLIDNNKAKLQCGHQFHFSCIYRWFSLNNQLYKNCPYCTKNALSTQSVNTFQKVFEKTIKFTRVLFLPLSLIQFTIALACSFFIYPFCVLKNLFT